MTRNLITVTLKILAVAVFVGDALCSGVKILIRGRGCSNQVITWIWRRGVTINLRNSSQIESIIIW
jgi:hypothetical protein